MCNKLLISLGYSNWQLVPETNLQEDAVYKKAETHTKVLS